MLTGPTRTMSLNEVEAVSAKAARGAGAGWGVAEDVARAARWMAERGFDWSTPLLRLLDADAAAAHLRPVFHVADLLPGAGPGDTWRLDGCEPVWVAAVLSAALHGRDLGLDLALDTGLARLRADGGVSTAEPVGDLLAPRPVTVTARSPAPPLLHDLPATARRSAVPVNTWHALEAYAARTTVPASARSRAGAGGGRVDAD